MRVNWNLYQKVVNASEDVWKLADVLSKAPVEDVMTFRTLAVIGKDLMYGDEITMEDFNSEMKISHIQTRNEIVPYLVDMHKMLPKYLIMGLEKFKECRDE